ncbi:hypothetical protein KFK09_021445 [Dendrobium nobile]|uniref:Uncharacterized protein n=1 Tax=Dendrobium nobile TaxID=94219 RepID=A0A8T3AQE5_DENNO|nr:hypothetical protein KFK09_021445 [Dendrobium nobile]
MKELKSYIQAPVRVTSHRDLIEAMKLTQVVEDQRHLERWTGGSSPKDSYRMTTTFLSSKEPTSHTLRETSKEKAVGGKPGKNFKKLTETELQEKRVKGLCFICEERYTPGK